MRVRIVFMLTMLLLTATTPVGSTGRPYCQTRQVVVYMTTWCPYCTQLRGFLQVNSVSFVEIDTERSGPEAAAVGRRGVPRSIVEGQWIEGYDPVAFRQALCIR